MPIVLALCVVLISAQSLFAQGFGIDSPTGGSLQSGAVAPPNGWKCPRNGQITARIDGGPELQFTEDLSRGDTAGICGNSGNNGFALFPWNWNESGDGQHTIEFFDAGVKFAEQTFTVATFGTPFLLGATGQCTIQDFPDPDGDIIVSWDQAIQNVRITQLIEMDQVPTGIPNVAGNYDGALNFLGENCARSEPFDFPASLNPELTVSQDGADLTIVSGTLTFEGTVEENSDFIVIEADPIIDTDAGCTSATTAGYSGNFLDGLLVFVIFQEEVSGNCTSAELPCATSYTGTLTAKTSP